MSLLSKIDANTRAGREFMNREVQTNREFADRWGESKDGLPKSHGIEATTVRLKRGSELVMRPVPWLWDGWIVSGGLTVLAGRQGTGKTTLAMALAATVTVGGLWPDGTCAEGGNVCIWSGEDDPTYTLGPRLALSGADMDRVLFVEDVLRVGEKRAFDPAKDMEPLRRALAEAGGCKLLIIDPIVMAVAGDSHKNAEVRRGLQPVVELAATLGCGLIGISHLTKGTEGRDPNERVTGSLAFGALARTVLMVAKSKDEGGSVKRLLVRSKNNLGEDSGGFEFDIEQGEVPGAAGVFASRVLWGGAIEGDARDLMAEAESAVAPEGAIEEAKALLIDVLRDGPVPAKSIEADALGAGLSWRTVERAKKELGIVAEKSGMKEGWIWLLPMPHEREGRQKSAKTATTMGVGLQEKMAVFEASRPVEGTASDYVEVEI